VKTRLSWALLLPSLLAVVTGGLAADVSSQPTGKPQPGYAYATNGVLETHSGPALWRDLVDRSNLGGDEVQIAEVTLAPGTTVGNHTHKSLEIIYVVSGTYGHEVNGHYYLLKPGMVGIVRPGDHVRHIVPQEGEARLLIIWSPGGELPFDTSKGTLIKPLSEAESPK
jgi:quercetin dioxygenase-like cupin family protein